MTPREKYGHDVPTDVIIHELGHTIVGHELGISEGGIQLCDPVTGEVARALYSTNGVTIRMRIIRGLAGAFAQAKLSPEQLPEGLTQSILDGSLFANCVAYIKSRTVPAVLVDAGFHGDWGAVIHAACENAQEVSAIVAELESAHRDLIEIYENRQVEHKVTLATSDFKLWLAEHDEDVPFMSMLIYPIARLRNALDEIRTSKKMDSDD